MGLRLKDSRRKFGQGPLHERVQRIQAILFPPSEWCPADVYMFRVQVDFVRQVFGRIPRCGRCSDLLHREHFIASCPCILPGEQLLYEDAADVTNAQGSKLEFCTVHHHDDVVDVCVIFGLIKVMDLQNPFVALRLRGLAASDLVNAVPGGINSKLMDGTS